jgi:rhamnogalacturonan endolyase
LLTVATIAVLLAAWVGAAEEKAAPVTLADDGETVTLKNGIVAARIEKKSAQVVSLIFREQELVSRGKGYWSCVGSGARGERVEGFGAKRRFAVRTNPKENGGERAEIACAFLYAPDAATIPFDVEIRYALGRGESGLYTYALWEHKAGWPAFELGEARLAVKLNPRLFDFLTIDAKRRRAMASGEDWDRGEPLNVKEARRLTTGVRKGEVEHKYDYSAILPQTPAWGWTSTQQRVGVWMINASYEYCNGGPTKVELTGHLDGNKGGQPTLLNMWQGSHYGGRAIVLRENDAWKKVVGPFLLYCNGGGTHEELWQEALARAALERKAWPYAWVKDAEYPLAAERACVTGRVVVKDAGASTAGQASSGTKAAARMWVGLAAAAYAVEGPDGKSVALDWQTEGKHYQFWTEAGADGTFTIPNVRAGTYTLYAFADGVLGEYSRADVSVKGGEKVDLGTLTWTPVRYGKTVWEIGVPDRSAAEFRHGDEYWQWGLYLRYPKEFPDDVKYTVGTSDWRRDWNYCQPPRIGEDGKTCDTTWSIVFEMKDAPAGKATLRMAISGCRGRGRVWVIVNGKDVGETGSLPENGVMHRDGIHGYWFEKAFPFDAGLLKAGRNEIKLRSRGDDWTKGVLYDYLRLELGEK